MVFIGGRRTGKSYCARSICYYIKDEVYDATVFTGSDEDNHPWTEYVPSVFVHDDYIESVLKVAIGRQKERKGIAKKCNIKPPSHLIVFEDLEYKQHNVFVNESARNVILNGRHVRTYPMALIQYAMKGITKECRSMLDLVFLQKEADLKNRDKLWELFGSYIKRDDFESLFMAATENFGTLVVNTRSNSYDPSDTFFWYKAKDMGQFHIGHPDFWKFDKLNNKDNDDNVIENEVHHTPVATACMCDPAYGIDVGMIKDTLNHQNACNSARRGANDIKMVIKKMITPSGNTIRLMSSIQ